MSGAGTGAETREMCFLACFLLDIHSCTSADRGDERRQRLLGMSARRMRNRHESCEMSGCLPGRRATAGPQVPLQYHLWAWQEHSELAAPRALQTIAILSETQVTPGKTTAVVAHDSCTAANRTA